MVKYEDSIAYNELEDGKCYSFELDEKEYILVDLWVLF